MKSIAGGVAALLAAVMLFVAVQSKTAASDARARATSLHSARLEVVEAQQELAGSDIHKALEAARRANEAALRVGVTVKRIAEVLEPTAHSSLRATKAARAGVASSIVARRQTQAAAGILGAISGYQRAASHYAAITNRALRRILIALRKTNEEFP